MRLSSQVYIAGVRFGSRNQTTAWGIASSVRQKSGDHGPRQECRHQGPTSGEGAHGSDPLHHETKNKQNMIHKENLPILLREPREESPSWSFYTPPGISRISQQVRAYMGCCSLQGLGEKITGLNQACQRRASHCWKERAKMWVKEPCRKPIYRWKGEH